MNGTISSKGQITVPAAVRERLGLAPGTAVTFELREGGVLLRKGGRGRHPVDAVYGCIEMDATTDDLIDEMRGPGPAGRLPGGAMLALDAPARRRGRRR